MAKKTASPSNTNEPMKVQPKPFDGNVDHVAAHAHADVMAEVVETEHIVIPAEPSPVTTSHPEPITAMRCINAGSIPVS